MKTPRILLLLTACTFALPAQENTGRNPYTTPEDIAAGGRIFRSHCAACHGLDGDGGRGSNLTSGEFRHGSSDQELADIIANGIPGTEMAGIFFDGKQLWQLIAFVRSLSQRTAAARTEGDPARGATLLRGKGGCLQCHLVNGEGGRSAPDLSDIGATRSIAYLRSAVLQPKEKVLPSHRVVRLVTRKGARISGRRLNEDTLSVQILDSNGDLVSVLKSEIAETQIDSTSAMPNYAGVLSNGEVDDLVAYLATLRKRRTAE